VQRRLTTAPLVGFFPKADVLPAVQATRTGVIATARASRTTSPCRTFMDSTICRRVLRPHRRNVHGINSNRIRRSEPQDAGLATGKPGRQGRTEVFVTHCVASCLALPLCALLWLSLPSAVAAVAWNLFSRMATKASACWRRVRARTECSQVYRRESFLGQQTSQRKRLVQ
jgi:hypothetical protein